MSYTSLSNVQFQTFRDLRACSSPTAIAGVQFRLSYMYCTPAVPSSLGPHEVVRWYVGLPTPPASDANHVMPFENFPKVSVMYCCRNFGTVLSPFKNRGRRNESKCVDKLLIFPVKLCRALHTAVTAVMAAMLSNVNCTHSSMDQWPVARLKESISPWISSHCVASSPDVGIAAAAAAASWSAVSAALIYSVAG